MACASVVSCSAVAAVAPASQGWEARTLTSQRLGLVRPGRKASVKSVANRSRIVMRYVVG